MQQSSIAIDGPAGAGKSTVAKRVAAKLQLLYVDTGAMYRAITWKIMQHQIQVTDVSRIHDLVQHTVVRLQNHNGMQNVFVDEHDVTKQIRSPEITSHVSAIAKIPEVRYRLVELQRLMAEQESVVMDGRDIGTYVLPHAAVKIFLTASIAERAKRRYEELTRQGYQVNLLEIQTDLEKRDKMDRERELAPLRQAEDAHLIDTTGKSIDQVIEDILSLYQKWIALRGGQATK